MVKRRESGAELLRIIAMVMIIGSHCLSSTNADTAFQGNEAATVILFAMRSVIVCGVNLFALITGYFMVNKNTASVRKLVELLLDVAIYGLAMYFISVLLGINAFSVVGAVKAALPILAGYRWFILGYCIVYLLSPYLNAVLRRITQKEYLVLLAIYAFFFAVWPTFVPYPPLDDYGYSFHHLLHMYLVGGYIQLHVKEIKKIYCAGVALAAVLVTVALFLFEDLNVFFLATVVGYKTAYNSVFIIAESISLFLIFAKLKFSNPWINKLAASAFSVFLLHGDYNMMNYMFTEIFHVELLYDKAWGLLVFPLYMAAIYVVFAGVDILKQKALNGSIHHILNKIRIPEIKVSLQEE